ncbi:MAG: hypothetical protein GY856_44865 [bacterium]|nr:hypothetical protein [bacterium]
MDKLRVRAYNVGFGDAILVTVPDHAPGRRTVRRHILIDVGNVFAGSGGDVAAFEPVVRNVLQELDGRPVDLYVMTHEHLDHVQGLYWASRQGPKLEIPVSYAWLTASSEPGYQELHPEAKERRLQMERSYLQIRRLLTALRAADEPVPATVEAMMLNNDWNSTRKCVKYLSGLARQRTAYVHRKRDDLRKWNPFKEAELRVWAPEEDTSVYYGRFRPLTLGVAGDDGSGERPRLVEPKLPEGVDQSSFERYLRVRRRGYFDGLLAIDAAANNTSVVLSLKWRDWHLLFPGDAEIRSWKQMNKVGVLEPVHFLKVSHHGSRNGTPSGELLNRILPPEPLDDRPRTALISGSPGTYKDVPSDWTVKTLKARGVKIRSLHDEQVPVGGFVDLEFPAPAPSEVEVPAKAEPGPLDRSADGGGALMPHHGPSGR